MSYGYTGFVVRLAAKRYWRFVRIGHIETWEGNYELTCGFRGACWVYRNSVKKAERMVTSIESRNIKPYRRLFEKAGYCFRD